MRIHVVALAAAVLVAAACGESSSRSASPSLPEPEEMTVLWRRSEPHYPGRNLSLVVLSPCKIWVTGMDAAAWSCGGDSLRSLPVGEGPGEFVYPWLVASWGSDSVVFWDRHLRRVSILAASGALGRVVSLPVTAVNGRVGGIFYRAGSLRVWTNPYPIAFGDVTADSIAHVWDAVPGSTSLGTPLMSFAGPVSTIMRDETTFSRVDAPVRRRPMVVSTADGQLLVGSTGSDTVTVHGWDGAVIDTLVLGIAGEPVTAEDRTRYADSVRKSFEDELAGQQLGAELNAFFRQRAKEIADAAEWPATRQRIDLMVAGDSGELWVLLPSFDVGYAREWRVYRRDGSVRSGYRVPHAGSVRAAAVSGDTLTTLEVQFYQDTVSLARYSMKGGE